MKLSTRYALVGIGALALLSTVHWLRETHSAWPPIGSFLIGVMPNVAAAIAMPFVFIGIWADQRPNAAPATLWRWFLAALIISFAGLIAWELLQLGPKGLVFDVNDLAATLVGTIIALAFFRGMTPRPDA